MDDEDGFLNVSVGGSGLDIVYMCILISCGQHVDISVALKLFNDSIDHDEW